MELEFSGDLWFWRGPAPFHFVTVPDEECGALDAVSAVGVLRLGHDPGHRADRGHRVDDVAVPEGRAHLVPVKDRVRNAEGLELGDRVAVRLAVDV
jgi:hypothetical protein